MELDLIKVEALRFAAELARNGALCSGEHIVSQMIEAAGQFEKFLRGQTDNLPPKANTDAPSASLQ